MDKIQQQTFNFMLENYDPRDVPDMWAYIKKLEARIERLEAKANERIWYVQGSEYKKVPSGIVYASWDKLDCLTWAKDNYGLRLNPETQLVTADSFGGDLVSGWLYSATSQDKAWDKAYKVMKAGEA